VVESQKQENKNLQYARLYHLMTPKSAFLLFDELFPGVKIKVQNHPENHLNSESYTATVEVRLILGFNYTIKLYFICCVIL